MKNSIKLFFNSKSRQLSEAVRKFCQYLLHGKTSSLGAMGVRSVYPLCYNKNNPFSDHAFEIWTIYIASTTMSYKIQRTLDSMQIKDVEIKLIDPDKLADIIRYSANNAAPSSEFKSLGDVIDNIISKGLAGPFKEIPGDVMVMNGLLENAKNIIKRHGGFNN